MSDIFNDERPVDVDKPIHALRLHECTMLEDMVWVRRVPGGWIYEYYDGRGYVNNVVFVPYASEFQSINELV